MKLTFRTHVFEYSGTIRLAVLIQGGLKVECVSIVRSGANIAIFQVFLSVSRQIFAEFVTHAVEKLVIDRDCLRIIL
jgi:hypothetical protein